MPELTRGTTVLAVENGASFWDDRDALRRCLREPIPRIPPWFGYDELGSELFESITRLPTYYLTRTERRLLERHADEMADLMGTCQLAELGSGSAKKTRLLLSACARRRDMVYLPIDVSREMLHSSISALKTAVPDLTITGLWGRYEAGLSWLHDNVTGPLVVAFLGSNLGNTTPGERDALLAQVSSALRPGDGFLVSADLLKSAAVFETCYNDPPHHRAFAGFRLNHLTHLNRRFGGNFDVERFRPHAWYDDHDEVVVGHLTATADQDISLPGLGITTRLRTEDSINVGFSAKFDRDRFVAGVAAHGLRAEAQWVDPTWQYGIFLFRRT
jgi:L-histidine N-alpha-methyltransferase